MAELGKLSAVMKAAPPEKKQEQKYYGIHACLALWKERPQDVIRVYAHESVLKTCGPLLKWCAQQKKAYHIISSEELNRITDSVHHEGLCLLAREPLPVRFTDIILPRSSQKICLLYLDGVQNPHNIGSILRTSAHFGIPYLLGENLPPLSPSACRVAKGGAEKVRLVHLDNPVAALEKLKKQGFALIGTSSHKGASLYSFSYPQRTILVFGSESHGLSPKVAKLMTHHVQIPGTGHVESLNVSVAASLCLGEYARQHLSGL